MSVTIFGIDENSIAEELGIAKGDILLSVNGEQFADALEYKFLIAEEYVELEIQQGDEIVVYEIEKESYEDIGLNFENSLMDEPRSCRNNCIFCFIDQLPKGLRKPLYFKDDDTRLSFLTGNYVTLTNVKDEELDKVIRLRLSPINISVHSTEPELRKQMLNNRFAGDIMEHIRKLTENGITVNCQIVLVKGVNDGVHLEKSLQDLSAFYPGVHSVSVVPVGISDHRDGLYPLTPFEKEDAEKVIAQVEAVQQKNMEEYGSRVVYIADEFYLKAEKSIPPVAVYEDFPQIENGVGMLASLQDELKEALKECCDNVPTSRKTIATGRCATSSIEQFVQEIRQVYPQLEVSVVPVENRLFGSQITVAGLLSGGDLLQALQGKELGDALLLTRSMLRAEGDVFLDDMTPEELSAKLHVPIVFVENQGKDFVAKILKK